MFQISYVILLAVYSCFVLTSLRPLSVPETPPTIEYILWVWVASMIIEELRQVRGHLLSLVLKTPSSNDLVHGERGRRRETESSILTDVH